MMLDGNEMINLVLITKVIFGPFLQSHIYKINFTKFYIISGCS